MKSQMLCQEYDVLQEQIQAWRQARNSYLRSRREALNNLNFRDIPSEKLKDNVDKDSDWPILIGLDSKTTNSSQTC